MKNKVLLVVLGLVIVVLLAVFSVYNNLVTLNENVDAQWAQVESQYQRRFDLIPNLVESVKGIMSQEKQIFTALAEARIKYSGAQTASEKAQAAGEVESALSRLLVVVENYPTLKSSENVSTLMVQIEGTENRISVERKNYNDLVREYQTKIKTFPTNLFAKMLGFSDKNYFESVEGSENAPQVDFN